MLPNAMEVAMAADRWTIVPLVTSSAFLAIGVPLLLFLYRQWRKQARAERPARISLDPPEQALPHWKGKRADPLAVRDKADPESIQCYCPATGQALGRVHAMTRDEIDGAVAAARDAQTAWRATSFSERRRVLNTIAKFLVDNQEDVARVACRDTGKTMVDASVGEIMVTLEKIQWIAANGEKALQPSRRPGSSHVLMFYKGAEVRYEPLGVVAAFVSWNYPLHNMMGPIVAGLFAGNGVVVKCAEPVAWSSTWFIEIARRALKACGHDPRLVQLVACWPDEADYLAGHPGLDHVTFIGSRPVAHKVAVAASRSLTPLVAELGGKDPLVVLDDAPVADVARIIMRGTFQAAGQNCIGVERVIALPRAYDALVAALAPTVEALRVGSAIDQSENIDVGATISDARYDWLEQRVRDAVAHGATLLAGGRRWTHPKYPQGHYFAPTMLANVTPDMEIAREEVFGPVLLLMRADSVDDAIRIANGTEFGLGASVFGRDPRLLDQVTRRLRCGNVAVNDFATYHVCQLPFGGVGGSGYGKFGGAEGLRGLSLEKSVVYDRFPFISTKIPAVLAYPIPDVKKAWAVVKAINDVGYARGVFARLRALRTLAKNQ